MDVCIHITEDGKQVQLLDIEEGSSTSSHPPEHLDEQSFAGTLQADTIQNDIIGKSRDLAVTGEKLFSALLKGRVLQAWKERIQKRAALENEWEQNGRVGARPLLRTYLCVANVDMANIPWELLTDPQTGQNLFADETAPWVRCDNQELRARQDRYQYRVRVLVINGADPDDKGIKAEEEAEAVRSVLMQCEDGFEFDPAPRFTSIQDLEAYTREYKPHILHFIGHSELDAGQGVLLISDGNHYLAWRPAEIGAFLGTIPTLRVAYLNACRTGTKDKTDKKASLSMAEVFLKRSLGVIAMHHDIRGVAAASCAKNFYQALVGGLPVDQALASARHALFLKFASREPYLPALTLRAPAAQVIGLRRGEKQFRPEDFEAEVRTRVTKHFVNHSTGRRQLHGLFGGPLADKRAILVTGAQDTGKSWLIQWVLHALALRGVRVHYLRKPSGDWLEILRLIRDEGATPLQQGGCTPEQASRFNWALEYLSQGKEPPPWDGREVGDSGSNAFSIVHMAANLPKRLCNAMQAALENSAGGGLVLALDQWELGSDGLERPGFKEIFEYLLTPLRKKNAEVRVILSLKSSQKIDDPPGWHSMEVPVFAAKEVPALAEELLRRIYQDKVDPDVIDIIRKKLKAEQPVGRLYSYLVKVVSAIEDQ